MVRFWSVARRVWEVEGESGGEGGGRGMDVVALEVVDLEVVALDALDFEVVEVFEGGLEGVFFCILRECSLGL